jgi:hypothetical protein
VGLAGGDEAQGHSASHPTQGVRGPGMGRLEASEL